jgi:hypothetical protein
MRCLVAGVTVALVAEVASSRRDQKTSRVPRLLDASYTCHFSYECHLSQIRASHLFPMSDL